MEYFISEQTILSLESHAMLLFSSYKIFSMHFREKSLCQVGFSKLQTYQPVTQFSSNISLRTASFQNFFVRLTCVTKHAKRDDYFLTSKSAVNVLQGAYRNADICFLFGKQESLRNETCSEVLFTPSVEECKFFPH